MASYHCSVKVGGKGKASGHAAYIAREGHYAEQAGYEDLEATGHGNLPVRVEGEPARFWSAADRHERADGATYREIEIALPRELNPAQRQDLVNFRFVLFFRACFIAARRTTESGTTDAIESEQHHEP